MRQDKLDLFNVALKDKIAGFDEDELRQFFLDREEIIKEVIDWYNPDRRYKFRPRSILIYSFIHGKDHFLKNFSEFTASREEYEAIIYNAVEDFCFAHDYVNLGYFAVGGFYDNPASCDVKTADDVMLHVSDEEELLREKQEFYVLEAEHLKDIIDTMEKNFDAMTDNTREDIDKIKEMHRKLVNDKDWKAAYIFSDY